GEDAAEERVVARRERGRVRGRCIDVPVVAHDLDQAELRDVATHRRLGHREATLGEALRERLLAADLVPGDEVADLLLPRPARSATLGRGGARRLAWLHRPTIR